MLTTAVSQFKELSGILGVFRRPAETASAGADDEFAAGLMDLILDIRSEARAAAMR